MKEYHKIQTIFKRDPKTKMKTLLEGEYSLPEFRYLQNNQWVFTEKVDGTNIRIIKEAGSCIRLIKGRTDRADIPNKLIYYIDIILPCQKLIDIFGMDTNVCLYGEGYGAKIQKGGGNYRQDQSFVLFDVKINDWWLKREDIEDIAMDLNIDIVPIVGMGTLAEMVEMVRKGFNSTWGNFMAEGIVARPRIELKARNGKRIITKVKCKDFILQ